MQCQMCNNDNPPTAEVCEKCGSALILRKKDGDPTPQSVTITEETTVDDPGEHFRSSSMTLTKKVTVTSEGGTSSSEFYGSMEKLLKSVRELSPEEMEYRKKTYHLMLFSIIAGIAALVCALAIKTLW